jgi:hypothetical protein
LPNAPERSTLLPKASANPPGAPPPTPPPPPLPPPLPLPPLGVATADWQHTVMCVGHSVSHRVGYARGWRHLAGRGAGRFSSYFSFSLLSLFILFAFSLLCHCFLFSISFLSLCFLVAFSLLLLCFLFNFYLLSLCFLLSPPTALPSPLSPPIPSHPLRCLSASQTKCMQWLNAVYHRSSI